MEQIYRISIFTTEGVIEKDYDSREKAITTIENVKKNIEEFVIGILTKKINREWHIVHIIEK